MKRTVEKKKYWRDYSEKEISRMKKGRCTECEYSIGTEKAMICGYMLITREKRPYRLDECEIYKTNHKKKQETRRYNLY